MYLDNVIYKEYNVDKLLDTDGILKRTNPYPETTPVFKRNYYIKDHLGNVRVVLDDTGIIKQVNNYYPFGMEYGESAETQSALTYQDYLFGGKEFDRKYEINMYDFEARGYDQTSGRFTTPDPLAEKYYSISPYAYCNNNPVRYTDPTGKWIAGTDGKPVIFTNGKWSPNASPAVLLVGNAMMNTEAGTAHLNDMLSPDIQKISINLDSKTLKSGDEYDTGVTHNRSGEDNKGNLIIEETVITIHTGSIAAAIGESAGNNQLKGFNFYEALGIVAGHEKGHTENGNIKQSYENDRKNGNNDVEARPKEIENEII